MISLSQWRTRKLPRGSSNYAVLSKENRIAFELENRIKNNLPRYKKQFVLLSKSGKLKFHLRQAEISYVLGLRLLEIAVTREGAINRTEISKIRIPYFGGRRAEVVRREMARVELNL